MLSVRLPQSRHPNDHRSSVVGVGSPLPQKSPILRVLPKEGIYKDLREALGYFRLIGKRAFLEVLGRWRQWIFKKWELNKENDCFTPATLHRSNTQITGVPVAICEFVRRIGNRNKTTSCWIRTLGPPSPISRALLFYRVSWPFPSPESFYRVFSLWYYSHHLLVCFGPSFFFGPYFFCSSIHASFGDWYVRLLYSIEQKDKSNMRCKRAGLLVCECVYGEIRFVIRFMLNKTIILE